MSLEPEPVRAARELLAMARRSRVAAIRHLVERENRLWAPLIHQREAALKLALADAAQPDEPERKAA